MGRAAPKTAVTNVRVFDGRQLQPPDTVVIEAGRISHGPGGAEVIDGEGGVLLPGLIDAHVHLRDRRTLEQLASFGVTTALDMACAPPELVNSLRGAPGLTDIRSAGTPAIAPGSPHSHIPVVGPRGLITGADQARQAGLTAVDALRAATSRPARYFGLPDRGVIEPGRRADLVLIDGDPLRDITATRSIRRVWCGGAEVQPSHQIVPRRPR